MAEQIDSVELANALLQMISKGKRHVNYDKTIAHSEEMAVHIQGDEPHRLLTDYRPNEDKAVHDYRLKIWQPITKSCSKRVINVINGINNPRYYTINFSEPNGVLASYPPLDEYELPYFGNVISWVFEIAVKQMLTDPNSVVAFEPIKTDIDETELYSPFGITYRSEQVLDYKMDEYYFLVSDEKSEVKVGNNTEWSGNIYKVFTPSEVVTMTQYGDKSKGLYEVSSLAHNIGEIPVITLGGEYIHNTYPFMYESYMSGVLPFWNDAIREYSDKQANFVQHVFLERVELQVQCDAQGCKKDHIEGLYGCRDGDVFKACVRCSGSGYISGRTPYGVTVVREKDIFNEGGAQQFPGVQYISKPTEIVTLLSNDIEGLVNKGYESVFMDLLTNVGANQSGIAKQYDRTDLERFLMTISNNIFNNIIYYSYKYIAGWRYAYASNEWMEVLPDINKPTNFDVLSAEILASQLEKARTAKLNPTYIDQLELDLINRQYSSNEKLKKKHQAFVKLDPLSNISEEDKFTRYANGAISEIDYIITSNIKKFVMDAINEVPDFLDMDYIEQYAKMVEYAQANRTNRENARPDRPDDDIL